MIQNRSGHVEENKYLAPVGTRTLAIQSLASHFKNFATEPNCCSLEFILQLLACFGLLCDLKQEFSIPEKFFLNNFLENRTRLRKKHETSTARQHCSYFENTDLKTLQTESSYKRLCVPVSSFKSSTGAWKQRSVLV